MKKLTAIQNELKAPKNQYNSFGKYKYRSCEDILEAVKPLLKKHDCTLTINDTIKEVGGITFVESTCIFYEDGHSISVSAQAGIDPNRKGMDIAQSFGSSSSYARKYALNGLFLIDDTKDADATNKPLERTETTLKRVQLVEGSENFEKCKEYILKGGNFSDLLKKYTIAAGVAQALQSNQH